MGGGNYFSVLGSAVRGSQFYDSTELYVTFMQHDCALKSVCVCVGGGFKVATKRQKHL